MPAKADPLLPSPEVSVAALSGSPDGPGALPCPPAASGGAGRPAAPDTGSACWGVWWAFLACVALILVAVLWSRIKAGIVAAWAWVKARFKRSPQP